MKKKINWPMHIAAWKESGLSKAEFCRRNNINKFSFYDRARDIPSPKRFVELPTIDPISDTETRPVFELFFQVPFEFRFKLNLSFGGKR